MAEQSQAEKTPRRVFCSLAERKAKYFELMQRAVHLGSLLPNPNNIDVDDPAAMADVEMIMEEFYKCRNEMEEIAHGSDR